MSKLVKGLKIFIKQGPQGVYKKALEKMQQRKKEADFKEEVRKLHVISAAQREEQKKRVFGNPVKFSIITPLYNTPEEYLLDLIESLEKQTYSHWELCLADGSDSEHKYVEEICREWERKDIRIVYSHLKENKGISQNTNECIKLAKGEYFGLLDHDDILHESALFEMMSAIEKYHADFLYSDEVKFSGKVEDANDFNFKPGFGKDELRSHNYICHFTVFSRELLEKDGRCYRAEFDGSQDHDMALRLTEKAEKIIHIPKVLYYWRVHPESVSMNLDSKDYAVNAAISAVREQLERTKEHGTVESNLPYQTIYRIKYVIEEKENSIDILVHGVKSIEDYNNYVKKLKDIMGNRSLNYIPVMEDAADTFGRRLNQAVSKSNAKYIIVIDLHCIPLEAEWIDEMLMYAQRSDVAAAAPKILFENNTIAYAGIALDYDEECKFRFLCQGIADEEQGYEAILRYVRNTTAVWRGCFMIERRKLESLGGFAENLRGYEEIDLSLKAMEHGFWNVWTCFSRIRYGMNSMDTEPEKDTESFVKLWSSELYRGDVFYHPFWKKLKLV